MPTRAATRHNSIKHKNDQYKRLENNPNEEFDSTGKKQSDYRRMQSYKTLQDYLNTYNK